MFLKRGLACGTRYIQFINPSIIERKCVCSGVPDYRFDFQGKISFIKSNFFSSYEGPPKNQSPELLRSGFNREEKTKLQKWIEMIKYEGGRVPENISDEQLFDVFSQTTEILKLKHLNYLFLREIAKKKYVVHKERLKKLKRQSYEERNNKLKGHIEYGLWKNTMFSITTKKHLKDIQNYKLVNAVMFNQPLVIDLDFYDYMERREVTSLSEQLKISITRNKLSLEPFNLTLCNVDVDCKKYQSLFKFMPNMAEPNFPINVTPKSYLDIFPKEKLVYLTPDARDVMERFDHEAIYIIGGLVNLRDSVNITLGKATRENIKTMKLPVEEYHISKKSNNDLAIHVMVNILLDLQKNGDFKRAFKNIPRRLLFTGDESHLAAYSYAKKPKS
ncbi:UNVERIFIED_CONTAM: hypothetical protein RMT77_011389 [Armadillidium vulgare]